MPYNHPVGFYVNNWFKTFIQNEKPVLQKTFDTSCKAKALTAIGAMPFNGYAWLRQLYDSFLWRIL